MEYANLPAFAQNRLRTPGNAWPIYTNSDQRFQISYPPGSHASEPYPGYIRIQNYTKTSGYGLNKGQYYMEIFTDGRSIICKNLSNQKLVAIGLVEAVTGMAPIDGDPGGLPFTLCAFRKQKVIEFRVTEPDKQGTLSNRIFNSIKFF
jgi:hypothetical protein